MSLSLTLDELLRYTDAERRKWRAWFSSHPSATDVPVQPGGRFPTVGRLIDHIFLVEQRHLQRLSGAALAESTGLTGNNAGPLFDYGASVRREFEAFTCGLDADEAEEIRTFTVQNREVSMTPRKLLFHVLLHEIRHWAQIAVAVRQAGLDPPGEHDLFYSAALR